MQLQLDNIIETIIFTYTLHNVRLFAYFIDKYQANMIITNDLRCDFKYDYMNA